MRKIYGFMVGHRDGEYYLKMHGMDENKPWSSIVYREQDFGKFTEQGMGAGSFTKDESIQYRVHH